MLSINLISEKLKKEIKMRNFYSVLKRINYIMAIIIVLCSTALVVSKGIMQNSFNRIVSETTLVTKNTQSYNVKVKAINQNLQAVSKIQDEYIPWCFLLDKIVEITPDDVSITSLKINRQNQTLSLSGHAGSRSGLLALKDSIEGDKTFKNFNFPIKNILQKENIDFDIQANIDIDLIKKNIPYETRKDKKNRPEGQDCHKFGRAAGFYSVNRLFCHLSDNKGYK